MSEDMNEKNNFVPRSERHKKKRGRLGLFVKIITVLILIFIVAIPLLSSDTIPSIEKFLTGKIDSAQTMIGVNREHEQGSTANPVSLHNSTEQNNKEKVEDREQKEEERDNKELKSNQDLEVRNDKSGTTPVGNENMKIEKENENKVKAERVIIHKVKENETLNNIAMIYYSSSDYQDKIATYNRITDPAKEVKAGMELTIPDPQFMTFHETGKGDTLVSISKKYYGTANYLEALAKFNGISNPNDLKYGTKLQIPNPAVLQKSVTIPVEKQEPKTDKENAQATKGYRLVVNKKNNQLVVYQGNKMFKTFSVGTGRDTSQTPEGEFKIVNKIEKPWYSTKGISGGDPSNPLGSHWLGLNVPGTSGNKYGIHGTNNPSSVGGHVSLGCIRMLNSDVEWLFNNIPTLTTVSIVNE